MTLNELQNGGRGRIYRVEGLRGSESLIERLEEMGFFAGAEIEVAGRLPLNGPWIVHLGASSFALRTEEASALEIQEIA